MSRFSAVLFEIENPVQSTQKRIGCGLQCDITLSLVFFQVVEQKEKVKQAAPDTKQLKQLEKKVDAYKKEYEKAQGKANDKEEEVHA